MNSFLDNVDKTVAEIVLKDIMYLLKKNDKNRLKLDSCDYGATNLWNTLSKKYKETFKEKQIFIKEIKTNLVPFLYHKNFKIVKKQKGDSRYTFEVDVNTPYDMVFPFKIIFAKENGRWVVDEIIASGIPRRV